MDFFIKVIANIAPYIYATCGLLALFQLYRVWQVRAERRQAVFSLEREKAIGDLYNIFLSVLLMLVVMGVTYFASTTLRTAMVIAEESMANNVPDASLTPLDVSLSALIPTPTFTPESEKPTAVPTSVRSSPTPLPAVQVPEDTPTPQPLPISPALCPDGRAVILSPGNGAIISGVVPIVGTAQHDQFSYYKLEFAASAASNASQSFSYFHSAERPVSGRLLGNLNSSVLPNGIYTIQLVVVDITGNYPKPCQVTVMVQN